MSSTDILIRSFGKGESKSLLLFRLRHSEGLPSPLELELRPLVLERGELSSLELELSSLDLELWSLELEL